MPLSHVVTKQSTESYTKRADAEFHAGYIPQRRVEEEGGVAQRRGTPVRV